MVVLNSPILRIFLKTLSLSFRSTFSRTVLPNRLSNTRIALIQPGDYPDTLRKVRDALDQAGATIASVTILDRAFPTRLDTGLAGVLPQLRANRPTLPDDKSAIFQ